MKKESRFYISFMCLTDALTIFYGNSFCCVKHLDLISLYNDHAATVCSCPLSRGKYRHEDILSQEEIAFLFYFRENRDNGGK
jgi:hypothetical protein